MSATGIPVTVKEDAAARVAGLGLRRPFEQMLEHARQVIPDLLTLRVTLEYDPERPEDDPQVVIWAHREEPRGDPAADRTDWDYSGWVARTFPPEVGIHFSMLSVYGDPDGW